MRRLCVALVLATAVLLGTAGSAASASGGGEGIPPLGHVFVIIGENTDYSHVTETNSPYTMLTLRPRSAWMSRYFAATHWSQANYVALMSGQFNRCQQQDGGVACHQDVDNLYHQLDLAGIGWKTWLEDEGARCGNLVPNDATETLAATDCVPHGNCPLTGFYTTGNPPINFDNIEGPGGVFSFTTPSQECLERDVQAGPLMAGFNADLAAGTVPRFNFLIPNGCEDALGGCAPIHNRYTQFDEFLRREEVGEGGHDRARDPAHRVLTGVGPRRRHRRALRRGSAAGRHAAQGSPGTGRSHDLLLPWPGREARRLQPQDLFVRRPANAARWIRRRAVSRACRRRAPGRPDLALTPGRRASMRHATLAR